MTETLGISAQRRWSAALIDFSIFFCIAYNVSWFLPQYLDFIPILLLYLIVVLFESSKLQGTPGKWFMGVKIQAKTGKRLSFIQATRRSYVFILLYFASLLIWTLLLCPLDLTGHTKGYHYALYLLGPLNWFYLSLFLKKEPLIDRWFQTECVAAPLPLVKQPTHFVLYAIGFVGCLALYFFQSALILFLAHMPDWGVATTFIVMISWSFAIAIYLFCLFPLSTLQSLKGRTLDETKSL